MITVDEYFGPWLSHVDATPDRKNNAQRLVDACNTLQSLAEADGVEFKINPITGSQVSGQQYGGFRPQDCTQGAPHSSHKEALAVDQFDPNNDIDEWCHNHLDTLEQCGIYIEAISTTPRWSHWTIRAPGSGHREFLP